MIRRVISQRCLGYSRDLSLGYYTGRAEMYDGEVKEVYLIARHGVHGNWQEGRCPTPPRPLTLEDVGQ